MLSKSMKELSTFLASLFGFYEEDRAAYSLVVSEWSIKAHISTQAAVLPPQGPSWQSSGPANSTFAREPRHGGQSCGWPRSGCESGPERPLYYIVLYHTIPYNTILDYTILYYTILYYTILHYTILYYTILYHTILD